MLLDGPSLFQTVPLLYQAPFLFSLFLSHSPPLQESSVCGGFGIFSFSVHADFKSDLTSSLSTPVVAPKSVC